jgi:hypothetical protein
VQSSAWLLVLSAAITVGCRSNPHDDTAPLDAGGGAGSGGTGGAGLGGSGAGGSGTCPLDSTGKERLKLVFEAVLEDADFVASGSHGIGVGAARAFGTRVPFSTLNLRKATTVSEICSGPKTFAPNCDSPEPGANGSFVRCVALTCEGVGVLSARAFIDPVPTELLADPPPGTVGLEELESRARFSDESDGSLAITLDGSIKLRLADGAEIRRTIGGDFINDAPGGNTLDVLSDIEGIATQSVALDATREGGALTGDVIVGGQSIASVDDNGLAFSAACAD